jgi:23S rRNA pseudouridine1911/1915/1917 synthase
MVFQDLVHVIPSGAEALPVDRALRNLLPGSSWSSLRRLIETGKLRINGVTVVNPTRSVGPGDTLSIHMSAPATGKRGALNQNAIVHVDAHVVVACKPAGILSVPYEAERDTFVDLVRRALERRAGHALPPLGIVHRIDKETSGLLVFSRRPSAKHALEQQFRAHTVRRVYAALVHGSLTSRTLRSRLLADRGDGLRGSTENSKLGQHAVTHVRAVEPLRGATLVECQLETGRTHQIRIHLSESGHPLLGERVYVRNYRGSLLAAPRLMLHAKTLGFAHPVDGRMLEFTSPLPEDLCTSLAELRQKLRKAPQASARSHPDREPRNERPRQK